MTRFILMLLALLPGISVAETDAVVKIYSRPCGKNSVKVGSGTLIVHDGSVHVLTSDHVVYHGTRAEGVCHSIRFEGRVFEANLVAANFLNGLALLEVNTPNDAMRQASIRPERDFVPSSRAAVFGTIAGYPGASTGLSADTRAQILSASSSRSVLPEVSTLLEVKGHSEFGMSGGALFDQNGRYAGLLSHQYLRMNLGAPSSVHEYEAEGEQGEFIALVIPAETTLEWLRGARNVRLDLKSQFAGKMAVSFEGVRFSAQACRDSAGPVGGRLDFGGEGAGIGGSEEKHTCRILVSLDKNGARTRFPFREGRWFDSLRDKLLAGGTAEIDGLYHDGKRYSLPDFLAFFSAVSRGFVPITKVQAPFVVEAQVVRALKRLGSELERSLAKIEPNLSDRDALTPVRELADALKNEQWDLAVLLNPEDLASSELWNETILVDFGATVDAKAKLLRIAEELQKVQL